MSYHSRNILPPGASRKRKERESFFPGKPAASVEAQLSAKSVSKEDEGASSNRLLAGYMAYEFLTRGTLFGQKFDPARAEAGPLAGSSSAAEWKGGLKTEHRSYGEVASILKTDGAHVPGIVNPTQLVRWIQM